MKSKNSHNFYLSNTTATKKRVTTTVTIAILFMQLLPIHFVYALGATGTVAGVGAQVKTVVAGTVVNTANSVITSGVKSLVPASSGILGKCVSGVLQQKVTAYAAGLVVAALSTAAQGLEIGLAVPVGANSTTMAASAGAGEGAASMVMSWVKPMGDCLIHEMTQMAIDSLNTAVNNAIGNGLGGSANTNQFTAGLINIAAGALRNQINGLALCDFTGGNSFRDNLSNSIAMPYYSSFPQQVECPFPATGVATARAFYGDFTSGGWAGFQTALQDNGNQFGVTLLTAEKLAADQAAALTAADKVLAQGKGYIPAVDTTSCTYPDAAYETYINSSSANPAERAHAQSIYCKVTTPGNVIAETAAKANTSSWGRLETAGAAGKPTDGFVPPETNILANDQLQAGCVPGTADYTGPC